jgi:hypothetical protein
MRRERQSDVDCPVLLAQRRDHLANRAGATGATGGVSMASSCFFSPSNTAPSSPIARTEPGAFDHHRRDRGINTRRSHTTCCSRRSVRRCCRSSSRCSAPVRRSGRCRCRLDWRWCKPARRSRQHTGSRAPGNSARPSTRLCTRTPPGNRGRPACRLDRRRTRAHKQTRPDTRSRFRRTPGSCRNESRRFRCYNPRYRPRGTDQREVSDPLHSRGHRSKHRRRRAPPSHHLPRLLRCRPSSTRRLLRTPAFRPFPPTIRRRRSSRRFPPFPRLRSRRNHRPRARRRSSLPHRPLPTRRPCPSWLPTRRLRRSRQRHCRRSPTVRRWRRSFPSCRRGSIRRCRPRHARSSSSPPSRRCKRRPRKRAQRAVSLDSGILHPNRGR